MPKRDSHIQEYTNKKGERLFKFHLYLGIDDNGKRVNITRQGFTNYNEAKAIYDQLRASGTHGYTKPKQIKTDEMYQLWFDNYMGQVKESTANKTRQFYKNHIKPKFGHQFMDKIQTKSVQQFADNKAKEIVKYREVVNLLGSLFEYAMRLGYVKENPVKLIIIPKKTSRPRRDVEHNVYNRKELDDFLVAAEKYNIRAYTYFKLLSSTGLRKSEALALTWQDIDLDNNLLHVNKTLALGLNNHTIIQPPKSKMSKRTLPVSSSLKTTLIEYRKSQKILSNKLFHTYKGTYYPISKPATWLAAIYKSNPDLRKITIHGFRHTFATLLISETNIKPKTVQMLLGHEDIKMTLDIYTHINEKNREDATKSIQQLNI